MRILHFGDVHIGVENYGHIDPETGLSTRLGDFLSTFDEVVSYATLNNIDLVLFCGDAYKNRDPSQTHQREFAKRIARLSDEGIPTFLLVGNHDMPHTLSRATALEIFRTLDVRNVYTGDTLKTYLVDTKDGPIQIVGLPWIRRSEFLTRDDTRGLTTHQVSEKIQKTLANAVRSHADNLDKNIPAIFAGHVTVSGSVTSSEKSMMLGNDHVLLKSDVALPEFDYVALGHIHRHQILNQNPYVVYSGSLQRVDFGEQNDQKGFCIIDIDPKKPLGERLQEFEFKPVGARNFSTISVDIEVGDTDPTTTVINTIANNPIENNIVRVMINIPGELEQFLREADIRNALKKAHYVSSISIRANIETRMRLGHDYTENISPINALKLYLDSRSVPKERADVVIEHAKKLIEEQSSGHDEE